MPLLLRERSILPGFGMTLGYTVVYLTAIVLIPLSALVWKSSSLSAHEFWAIVTSRRVMASYELSFIASLIAAAINAVAGTLLAWVLVRYRFPGRRLLDGLVDLPFALPTAVAGITLTSLYARHGWLGGPLSLLGITVAFTPLGVVIALIFIGLPFVVRTVQPVLEQLGPELEEAAGSLGAGRWSTVRAVIFPEIWPAIATGFALSFARGVGEYGSVVFIAGNQPMKTEIAPLLIITKLEQYDYAGATAIAVVMLGLSFLTLVGIGLVQRFSRLKGI
jgi:sulfate transport system permease protein